MHDPAALLGLPLGEAQAVLRAAGEPLLPPVYTYPTTKRSASCVADVSEPRVLRAERTSAGCLLTVAIPLGFERLRGDGPC